MNEPQLKVELLHVKNWHVVPPNAFNLKFSTFNCEPVSKC